MKKMIKPIPALLLIIMVVIVLMKINRTWALNPEQNLDEASALNYKKNLNLEYFINNIDSDTTFIDLEREIGPFTGSIGCGIVIDYYEAEELFFYMKYQKKQIKLSNLRWKICSEIARA